MSLSRWCVVRISPSLWEIGHQLHPFPKPSQKLRITYQCYSAIFLSKVERNSCTDVNCFLPNPLVGPKTRNRLFLCLKLLSSKSSLIISHCSVGHGHLVVVPILEFNTSLKKKKKLSKCSQFLTLKLIFIWPKGKWKPWK